MTPSISGYTPPTPEDLRKLRKSEGLPAYEMSYSFCIAPDQYRKYSGGAEPRTIEAPRAFTRSAFKVLPRKWIEAILADMASFGAYWDINAPYPPPPASRYVPKAERDEDDTQSASMR